MKTIKGIYLIFLMLLLWHGCTDDLEYIPIDQITTDEIVADPRLLIDATTSNYAALKGTAGRGYIRDNYDAQVMPSDNVLMMRWSGAPLTNTLTYLHTSNSALAMNVWRTTYHTSYAINVVLEAIENMAAPDAEIRQLQGENLWLRAMFHFDCARAFARPYSHDSPETNLGIVLSKEAVTGEISYPERATVKETYEFIESDLLRAEELMMVSRRNVYASKEVAQATLARLYLFMEQNEKAIEYADKVINSGRYQLIDTENLPQSYTLGPSANPETIFAVKVRSAENRGRVALGSMFHRDGGWAEMALSESLLDLLFQNENDQRIHYIDPDFKLDADGNKIPDPNEPYYGYAVNDRFGMVSYSCLKGTYEYGEPMLHSRIYFRLAEMYLIKAEAHAKLGQDQNALDMVNIIRERAGLDGDQLFTTGDLKGYDTVLDVVLDEKRLEFFLEGHRAQDIFRNKKYIDRTYLQWQGWSGPAYIPYTSNRIVHYIPEYDMTRNPNLVQNPTMEPPESMPTSPPGN